MATNVRELLKAKTKERQAPARITHQYAAYMTSTNQLKCALCAVAIKNNDTAAWEGHLATKAHRANAGKAKETERKQQEKLRLQRKQKERNESDNDDPMDFKKGPSRSKRARTAEPSPQPADTTAVPTILQGPTQPGVSATSALPPNFFSDANRALPITVDAEEDEEDVRPAVDSQQAAQSKLEDEWAQFEADLIKLPLSILKPASAAVDTNKDVYDRATVFAPALVFDDTPEGFPAGSTGAGNVSQQNGAKATAEEGPTDSEAQKLMEEKELMMDRMLDEERAQEEADERVLRLKERLENIKKKRAWAKGGNSAMELARSQRTGKP